MLRPVFSLCLMLGLASSVTAQSKPPAKDGPRVLFVAPLGSAPGAKTKLIVRGLKLDTATEIKFNDPKVTAKILKAGKVTVPNMQLPACVGDTQVEIEATLPADLPEGAVPFVVVTPAGTSEPHRLLVTKTAIVAEKEANGGFQQSQPLTLPALVEGSIGSNQDVDVFHIEAKAGQKLIVETLAARHGSPADLVVYVHDAAGNLIAAGNDTIQGDVQLEFAAKIDGRLFITVIDAHDHGGPTHVYRLSIKGK